MLLETALAKILVKSEPLVISAGFVGASAGRLVAVGKGAICEVRRVGVQPDLRIVRVARV